MAYNGDGSVDELENATFVPAILAMADCFEPDSENQKLIDFAVGCAASLGTDVTILDLRDLELPSFQPDRAASEMPQGAHAFRQLLYAHDGLLIALPSDYGDYPPLLLNAIAWSASPAFGDDAVGAFAGKCASLLSATGKSDVLDQQLVGVRAKLSALGVLVLPDAMILSGETALSVNGSLVSVDTGRQLEEQLDRFIGTIRRAHARGAS